MGTCEVDCGRFPFLSFGVGRDRRLVLFLFEKVEEIKLPDSLNTIGNNAFCTNFLLKRSHLVSFFKMLYDYISNV